MLNKIIDGRTDLVIDLIEAGQSPSFKDENGVSLMQWCAYYGDVSAVKVLLANGASLTELGENLDLNGAVFHGHWQLSQFLIEEGANVNYTLPDTGESPLHAALCKLNRPVSTMIVELLLKHGANPTAVTIPNRTTGMFMRDVRTRGETPLHRAAAYSDLKSIQLLLSKGADKTKKDFNGDTPLTWASWHLRPAFILAELCYGDYSIHPERVKSSLIDHA